MRRLQYTLHYILYHTMKTSVLIIVLIAVQMAAATIPIDKITDKITEKVHAGLKTLKEKAVTKLHKLKEGIDLKKLHQLDVLHLLPYAHKHYVHEQYSKKTPLIVDQHQIHRLKHYFEPHHKPAPIHYHHFEHFEHL